MDFASIPHGNNVDMLKHEIWPDLGVPSHETTPSLALKMKICSVLPRHVLLNSGFGSLKPLQRLCANLTMKNSATEDDFLISMQRIIYALLVEHR